MGERGKIPTLTGLPRSLLPGSSTVALTLSLAVLVGCSSTNESAKKSDRKRAAKKTLDQKKSDATKKTTTKSPIAKKDSKKVQSPPDDKKAKGGGGLLEEIARNRSLKEQEKIALSEHYTRVGQKFYEQFRFREAKANLEKAVQANPDNTKARYLLQMSGLLLGDNKDSLKSSAERLKDEREVRLQQERIELRRLYDSGDALFKETKYDLAIRKFEQVLERIKWSPYNIDSEGLEDNARKQIIEARSLKREQDIKDREEKENRALIAARSEERSARAAKKRKVELLIKRATDQLRLNQFEKAEETIKEVLEEDADNQTALRLRNTAIEGRHVHYGSIIASNDREEFRRNEELNREAVVPYLEPVIFPGKEEWDMISRRGVGVAPPEAQEPNWILDYKKVLRTRKVTINFTDTPFADVISFLQDITGLNITVSQEIDKEELRVNLRLNKIILQNAFNLLLQQTDLAMTFENETLKIVPKEGAKGKYYLDILDVQDILSQIPDFPGPRIQVSGDSGGGGGGGGGGAGGGQTLNFGDDDDSEEEGSVIDPEKLTELVRNSTGEDNWEDPASIEVHRGQLIVFQTPEVQKQIITVLENLRRNSGLFVQIETRFVSLFNDFLRDIGVDYRDLGQSNAPVFGAPLELDPSAVNFQRSTGTPPQTNPNIIGIGRGASNRATAVGPVNPATNVPTFGADQLGGRLENIVEGSQGGFLAGRRLNGTAVQASGIDKGATLQATFLDPIQVNAILKMDEERSKTRTVQAPVVTAANRQRVYISVVTQRAYISDYELSSGGTGLAIAEVADPVVETFQEGIVLDVRPTVSHDRKYITLDVKPTLAILVGGDFGRIPVNLGTQTAAAINVNIEVPQVQLQEAFTTVTIPDGGTALLGGLRIINEANFKSGLPALMELPVINVLAMRKSEITETQSLMILIKAKMISLRETEAKIFNTK